MIYQIFLACFGDDLLEQTADYIRQSGIPAVVGCYRSAGGLMAARYLSRADAVVLDAALPGSDMAVSALAGILPRGRLLLCGAVREERLALAALRAEADVFESAEDVGRRIAELLAEKPMIPDDEKERIAGVMNALGLEENLKGSRYISEALHEILTDASNADNLKNGLYREIAERCHVTAQNVERSIRYAINQSWTHMNSAQRRRLMPQCSHRPGNRMFLMQMARQVGGDRERREV